MWPREGIVIRSIRQGLIVRLRNGAQVLMPHQKQIGLGDTVFLNWNFHTNEPQSMLTWEEYHADDVEIEPDVDFHLPPHWAEPQYWAIEPDV